VTLVTFFSPDLSSFLTAVVFFSGLPSLTLPLGPIKVSRNSVSFNYPSALGHMDDVKLNLPLGRVKTPLSALANGNEFELDTDYFHLNTQPVHLPALNTSSDLCIEMRTRGDLVVCQDILLDSRSGATLAILKSDDGS
jgi:hypothetical protein